MPFSGIEGSCGLFNACPTGMSSVNHGFGQFIEEYRSGEFRPGVKRPADAFANGKHAGNGDRSQSFRGRS